MKIEMTMTEFQKLLLPAIGPAIIQGRVADRIEFETCPAPHVIITFEDAPEATP